MIRIETLSLDVSGLGKGLELIGKALLTLAEKAQKQAASTECCAIKEPEKEATETKVEPPKKARKPKDPTPVCEETAKPAQEETTGGISFEGFKNQLLTSAAKLGNRKTMAVVTEITGCNSIGKVPPSKFREVLEALAAAEVEDTELIA